MTRLPLAIALFNSLFLATFVTAQSGDDGTIAAPPSDAERIAQLRRAIAEGETQIGEIKGRLEDPGSEYALAGNAFTDIDGKFAEAKKVVETLRGEGKAREAEAAETLVAELDKKRQLARERFDLAIEERKATQQQLATVERKLDTDRVMLERLVAPPPHAEKSPEAPGASSAPSERSADPAAGDSPTDPSKAGAKGDTASTSGGASEAPAEEVSEELVEARREATSKQQEAKLAKEDARSLSDRLQQTKEDIALERRLLSTARQKSINAQKTRDALNADLQKRLTEGETWSHLAELREQIEDVTKRLSDARDQIQRHRDRIDSLQSEQNDLQSQELAASQEVRAKQAEAAQAQEQVERLQNPFSFENILKWIVLHGPMVLFTIVGMFAVLSGARIFERRFVTWLAMTSRGGTPEDRENRAQTLVSVFHNAVRVVVIGGGLLMIAYEFGINVVPLLGGAAVLGLAAAFGAQNLIRDYFYGFIMLLENQYTVNDVIKIGDAGGVVERITLRITVLRDLEGTVHFIPHGTIDRVSNMTHGWSRALFSVGVAYKEDVDRVMDVLMDLGRELRKDPKFAGMILDEPEMLGVDSFGESEVVIKFFIKTRTLKQWAVKRELLRRIKYRFDELGIEIPFPHRTIFHHHSAADPPPSNGGDPFADA